MRKKAFVLKFTPEAIEHIDTIATWYNDQSTGLGERFKRTSREN